MPAHYLTWPRTDTPIFECAPRTVRFSGDITLDMSFLSRFGTFSVPRHIWEAMGRYACWIEPAINLEWARLMTTYDRNAGHTPSLDAYMAALAWLDPIHDTSKVRKRAAELLQSKTPVYCAWSGKRLKTTRQMEIDHCLPFAHWPNNDLWNLLPVKASINTDKRDRLPTPELLATSQERIIDWWQRAYLTDPILAPCFDTEARAALPLLTPNHTLTPEAIFDGLWRQRLHLRQSQQLLEWGLPSS